MRAVNRLRDALHYRKDAFSEGLQAAGYEIVSFLADPQPGDVLLIWNRYGRFHDEALRFEAAGARVLVAENGYLGRGMYTVSEGHHAGAGKWYVGGPERWAAFNIEIHPWRYLKGETLVLGQRSIGELGIASPLGWEERMRERLPGSRIRPHPGKEASPVSLVEDLQRAEVVVTWASSAAFEALLLGIPVWCNNTWWAGASAASFVGTPYWTPEYSRLNMFRKLAWCLWTLEEIRKGEPFRCV